ncbi:helix-turn-helix domain-containing protein [Mumia flava]|uniref:helix-turn-helix domain-containing protein n=1 Tax=Mumia flava TaxID=1348852 RepID=UPI001FE6CB9C|nr:helix-turn-helix domain-containing protein [Mumia flava]
MADTTGVVPNVTGAPVGEMVRRWRKRRHRSQLDVSIGADLSARHLSFIESGRANPSRAVIERLCDELDVPLRERNAFHLAAGLAPAYPERPLADLGVARSAVEVVLAGHEPNPALAVNVRWELLAANAAMQVFLDGIAEELLEPPVNVLRATLHPAGLAPRIQNLGEWRAHTLRRVRRQWERTAADGLPELLAELESYPVHATGDAGGASGHDLVVPMQLAGEHQVLSFHYAITVFGAARDVTLDEIAIETFFPADAATAAAIRVA